MLILIETCYTSDKASIGTTVKKCSGGEFLRRSQTVAWTDLPNTAKGLKKYLATSNPVNWLFNGKVRGSQISRAGIRHAFRACIKKAGINKEVCVHTLRHSYATHLLEMGLDIVSVKNQLGHVYIATTMMYLHVAESNSKAGFAPMEKLYSNGVR